MFAAIETLSPELWPLLLGPYGLLVGSLLLNWLQASGILHSRKMVPREDYEKALGIASEGNEANERLAKAVEERNRLEAEEARMAAAVAEAMRADKKGG